MPDLFDRPHPGQNLPEFTVSGLSAKIRRALEESFDRIRVRGEVGRVFHARSGHLYFDIKDDRNVLACTVWKSQVPGLSVLPEEGLEVVVTGKVTAYGAQSKYNMNVDGIAVAGQGALLAMLERRRKKLAAEGLFDRDRKPPLPFLPQVIGVVTSPRGAVIRDILHRLRNRFPRQVLVWPVAVQGPACAAEVARAIGGFNRMSPDGAISRPDLLIVARGGGSVEDLWGFNEEIVVRAAADSSIPVISAVGHESDTTLIDHAVSLRAPTPTAAAEMAVPVRLDLLAGVESSGARLLLAMGTSLDRRAQRLRDLSRAMPGAAALLDRPRRDLDRLVFALPSGLNRRFQFFRWSIDQTAARLRPTLIDRDLERKRADLDRLASALPIGTGRGIRVYRGALDQVAMRLRPALIASDLRRRQGELDRLAHRLCLAAVTRISHWRARFDAVGRMHETLGYKSTLRRGYAVARQDGGVVTSSEVARDAQCLELEFHDGRVDVVPTP